MEEEPQQCGGSYQKHDHDVGFLLFCLCCRNSYLRCCGQRATAPSWSLAAPEQGWRAGSAPQCWHQARTKSHTARARTCGNCMSLSPMTADTRLLAVSRFLFFPGKVVSGKVCCYPGHKQDPISAHTHTRVCNRTVRKRHQSTTAALSRVVVALTPAAAPSAIPLKRSNSARAQSSWTLLPPPPLLPSPPSRVRRSWRSTSLDPRAPCVALLPAPGLPWINGSWGREHVMMLASHWT